MVGNVEPCKHTHENKQDSRDDGTGFYELSCLLLKRRILGSSRRNTHSNLTVLGRRAGFLYLYGGVSLRDERTGLTIILTPVIL